MTQKKNVHRSGALASILDQSGIKPVDLELNKKSSQSAISETTFNSFSQPPYLNSKTELLIEISPSLCKSWEFSDRLELEMGNIEELANSIQQAGQQEPILVRPIKTPSPAIDSPKYEIIFGNRRWRACKLIGKNLLAIVRDLTDQEAALAQKEENENRKDISEYSKALHYQRLIDSGVFVNENQLAIKLNIPRNRFNDLMSYNRIPKQLLDAIPNVHNLSQRLAIKLASLSKNVPNFDILLQLAPQIGSNKLTSVNIDKAIEVFKSGKSTTLSKKSAPVIGKGGAEIFTIREDSNGAPCIVLHKVSRQAINIDELKALIKSYIDKCIENNFSQ